LSEHMSRARQDSPTLNPLVILAGVILILYFARAVLIPLAFALVLTFLLAPFIAWLEKIGMRRLPSVAIAIFISLGAFVGLGSLVSRQLLKVADDLPRYRLTIDNKIEALRYRPDSALGRAAESLEEITDEIPEPESGDANSKSQANTPASSRIKTAQSMTPLPVQVVRPPARGLAYMRETLIPLTAPIGMAGMVLIFTIFILIKQEDLRNRLLRLAGVGQLHAMTLALDDATHRISRYLGLQILVNACYGACFGVGLFLIGIPDAALWGVIAGILRIVPYAGALTATIFPFILALAVFNGWGPPVLVVLLYVLLEIIAANIVEPWLYGAHTGISALALLVTTVFWTLLWGWAGLILAIPLTVCVIVLGQYVPRLSFLHILLGDETALSLEAQFYQRLLALDQEDARTIATTYLKDHSLVSLYDRVLIPALTLAEHDRHKGALDATRESYLFLSVSEIVSELAVYRNDENAKTRVFGLRKISARQFALPSIDVPPEPSAVRIFCLAGNDQADEIASSMLAQLLERNGHGVVSLPAGAAAAETLTHLLPEEQDVICISALLPFAFAQASALCQRIRAQLPTVRIVVGIWGFSNDFEKAAERFGNTRPDRIVATLADALEQIGEWHKVAVGTESKQQ
jgi:predicted PurR-regulated permease PerM